jgi:glycosyltransferase involved in cell wall biosynthesis
MLNLFVVINCGQCGPFVDRCLASLQSQNYSNWRAMVTVDPCGDETYRTVIEVAGQDPRIEVRQNSRRRYSLENLVRAVHGTPLDPEDVIVILDGDDWLNVDNALATVAETYHQHACWLTYGSWVSSTPDRHPGRWPPYPRSTKDFRAAAWLGTHLRTWKRWLWDLVNDNDLRDNAGHYFRVAVDVAVMLPLFEICGTDRARHIADPIYFLNRQYDWRTSDERYQEQQRNEQIIRSRPAYPRRLTRLP